MSVQTLTGILPQISSLYFPEISKKKLGISAFLLLFVLSFLYFYQARENIQANFLVSRYEAEVDSLIQANKDLEAKVAQVSSFDNLEEVFLSQGYEEVGTIHYIKIMDNAIAKAE